ncbi:serine/threonine-protein kinase TOR-like [Dorcoceras hygrometricum]|uniref:Serine/threonine-protein kinase TOR-like n=1 Tax=Dorcoceras hygrometricum TaxID=472368 RepID=A0A2Z7CEJ5_9LAMI|nr:serine/threonine-protein kinase TOR-like [Dorcoceras hygrometricum]
MLAAGCPVVGREMLATGFLDDWLDQTMSYQLIQTTSFAKHPRLLATGHFFLYDDASSLASGSSNDWFYCSFLLIVMSLLMSSSLSAPAGLYRSSSNLRLFLASVPADLSSSADHDVVTDDIIIDGPLRCSSWFPFDVPASPSSSSSACSWFISFQLVHYTPAGSTWPPPDYEQLTQLWTSPLLIQLPFIMINQTNC